MPRTRRFVVPPWAAAVALVLAACGGVTGPNDRRAPAPSPATTLATASSTARQSVEALLSGTAVGGTVPADALRDRLAAAVTEAGSYRVQFDDIGPVDVTAVLEQSGLPAARVVGMGDTNDTELRLVGEGLYELDRRHPGGARWVVSTRDDPHELLRLTDDDVEGVVRLGSPGVLVDALGPGPATVTARAGDSVTLSVPMDVRGFTRATGAEPVGPDPSSPSAARTVPSTWVVTAGLPVRVLEQDDGEWHADFRFSRWGRAGPVEAPPAHLVETMEQHHILEKQRRSRG